MRHATTAHPAAGAGKRRTEAPSDAGRRYRFEHLALRDVLDDMRFTEDDPGPGDRMPAFDLPTVTGGRIRSTDFAKTGPALVIFGSSTCPVTDNAAPGLNELYRRFGDVFADGRGYGMSRYFAGRYSVEAAAADTLRLADVLGWDRFHLVGHSMTGMVVQRVAVDDWTSKARRLKSVVAITPVSADGYPADVSTKQFLWELIGKRDLSEQGFSLLTGQRLSRTWARVKTMRHLQTASLRALKGYYRMWLEADFSELVRRAEVRTPFLVIGGRQDLPGFQEEHLRKTFGAWYPNVQFAFITDAGHYPMQETPAYLASLMERFLGSQVDRRE